jgi:hypothetical protein
MAQREFLNKRSKTAKKNKKNLSFLQSLLVRATKQK